MKMIAGEFFSAVDQEEKHSCFVRNRTHHERLTCTGRAKTGGYHAGLDTDQLE